jgi:hypothetical protein
MPVFALLRQIPMYLRKTRIHRTNEKQRADHLRLEVIIFITAGLESSITSASFCSTLVLAIVSEMRELFSCFVTSHRAVAQLGRAPGSGPGGRGFKSHQPDCFP